MSETPSLDPAPPTHHDALARIEARLDHLEASIGRLTALLDQAPALIATAVDSADNHLPPDHGADIDARLRHLTRLTLRLTEPRVLATLEQLLDAGEQAPGQLAMAVDVVDDLVQRARARGLEPVALTEALASSGLTLATLLQSPELRALLASPAFAPHALATAHKALNALADTSPADAPRVGMLGLLNALRDDNVRRALGFALEVARAFGAALADADTPRQLPG
ncbi:DUF1641 domain-containing protein [Bradymonadaceae bacterium TMQ3]|nr:DUF1641 domain-containing protein [Bradymonadaceae bacterium TMQ3]TXC74576.1 DUF1641 domain-containing protein [Bradymonadales bacterium TMQ1]